MDSNNLWSTELKVTSTQHGETIHLVTNDKHIIHDTGAKDPVHQAIKNHFLVSLSSKNRIKKKFYESLWHNRFNDKWTITVDIKGALFLISKDKRYSINGSVLKRDEIANVLARVLFKSCFTDDIEAIYKHYFSIMETPEIVRYVVENRVPYYFYDDFTRHDVRLNVVRTGDKDFAIEIGDGFWGDISVKNLESFAEFYVNGRKNKWAYTSPYGLYEKLVGSTPKPSDLKVMIAFLKQNRKKDIVERRAEKLVDELLEQFPDRLKVIRGSDGKVSEMQVVGKGYDWRLTTSGSNSRTQAVSTYVWQPTSRPITDDDGEYILDDDGDYITEWADYGWKGSICIDNINENTPVGDQFASRALALLNDTFTIKMVSTIKNYLACEPNEVRIINENKKVNKNEVSGVSESKE